MILYPICPNDDCNEPLPLPIAAGATCAECGYHIGVTICDDCGTVEGLTVADTDDAHFMPNADAPEMVCAPCAVVRHASRVKAQMAREVEQERRRKQEKKRDAQRLAAWQDANSPDLAGELPALKTVKNADEVLCVKCRGFIKATKDEEDKGRGCGCRCECGLRLEHNYRGAACPWCDGTHQRLTYGTPAEGECGRNNVVCKCDGKAERRALYERADAEGVDVDDLLRENDQDEDDEDDEDDDENDQDDFLSDDDDLEETDDA